MAKKDIDDSGEAKERRGITDALMDKKSVGHILIDANDLRKIARKNKNRVGIAAFRSIRLVHL